MSEQLETVVKNQDSKKETEKQILNQKFSIEGYTVVIFYSKKTLEDRYITIEIINETTEKTKTLDPIKMVSKEEVEMVVEQQRIEAENDEEIIVDPDDDNKYEDLYPDSGIDILDLTHALEAVDLYLFQQRHQPVDRNLAKVALAA